MSRDRLLEIHQRLANLAHEFHDIPEDKRTSQVADPIRDEIAQLHAEAETLLPEPELPDGFRFGFPKRQEYGKLSEYGFRILPCCTNPFELWGVVLDFTNANEILEHYNMEICPSMGDDFILVKKGSHAGVGLRKRLIGPPGKKDLVEHLFLQPKEASV